MVCCKVAEMEKEMALCPYLVEDAERLGRRVRALSHVAHHRAALQQNVLLHGLLQLQQT